MPGVHKSLNVLVGDPLTVSQPMHIDIRRQVETGDAGSMQVQVDAPPGRADRHIRYVHHDLILPLAADKSAPARRVVPEFAGAAPATPAGSAARIGLVPGPG